MFLRHAALALVVAVAATAVGTPAAAADATVTVVKVRATGSRAAGDALVVDPALERLRARIQQLPLKYSTYTHDETVTRDLRWGEALRVLATEAGGRLDVSAEPSKAKEGHVVLHVSETAPGDSEPCVVTTYDERAGRHVLVYCDGLLRDGTLLFFVTAEPL